MEYFTKIILSILEKLADEAVWLAIGAGFLKILGMMIASSIVVRVGKLAIQNIFAARRNSLLRISERREATLLKLLQNILTYVTYFIAILMILSTLNVKVGALLAGAGIVGLAVGFGAQSLVKDIITGFFIIFEDQFSVGDHVRIGQFEGTVEEIGLRTTKIKQWTGELHILPNGSIVEVTNFSLHNSVAVIDISVSYEEDIKRVEQIIRELLAMMKNQYEDIVSEPQLLGVQSFGASEVLLRVTAETAPMKHFPIARELRREIKLTLDKHGIEIPFPRLIMYSRQENEAAYKKGV